MSGPAPLTRATLGDFPLPPVEDGEKNSRGRLLVIAGSRELAGAALLCATAAMRAGCGKLKIAGGGCSAGPGSASESGLCLIALWAIALAWSARRRARA